MNDVFKQHGIKHLSASSINTYIKDPAKWILRYLYNKKLPGSPAMWRGSAVDYALGLYFKMIPNQTKSRSLSHVQEDALEKFEYEARQEKGNGFEVDQDKYEKEKHFIPDYIATAVDHYKTCGDPVSYQEKIIYEVDGLPVPIIGYIDFKYEDVLRDIKTASRKPQDNTHAISRQLALYGHVTGCKPVADYIICTKHKSEVVSYEVSDVKGQLRVLEEGAYAIQNLLSVSDNMNDLAKLVLPNFDDWMWSHAEQDIAKSIWRIK